MGGWGRGLGCLSGGQKRRLAGTPLCPGHQQLLLRVLSQRKPFLGDDKSQLCPRGGVTNCPRRWAELPESEGRPRGAPWGLMASLEGGAARQSRPAFPTWGPELGPAVGTSAPEVSGELASPVGGEEVGGATKGPALTSCEDVPGLLSLETCVKSSQTFWVQGSPLDAPTSGRPLKLAPFS